MVVLDLVWAGTGYAATANRTLPRFPFCSWWFVTTPQSANVALPDTVFRNMLGDGFANSVQQVPQDGKPTSAQAVMGAYYPRLAQCPVSTFTQGGASACFAAGS
jgi:hypothetical protein